jgi:hypothetical protein
MGLSRVHELQLTPIAEFAGRLEVVATDQEAKWTVIYETPSESDADVVRMTLEVAGYRVSMQAASPRDAYP